MDEPSTSSSSRESEEPLPKMESQRTGGYCSGSSLFSFIITVLLTISCVQASDLGVGVSDGAASQVVRLAMRKLLEEPRQLDVLLTTQPDPELDPMANINLDGRLKYRNMSVAFHPHAVHVVADMLSLVVDANVSALLFPIALGDQHVDLVIRMDRAEFRVALDDVYAELDSCALTAAAVSARLKDNWVFEKLIQSILLAAENRLDDIICALLRHYISGIEHNNAMRFPVYELIPKDIGKVLVSNRTALYYKIRSMDIQEQQLFVRAQLEWSEEPLREAPPELELNSTVLNVELRGDDRVTVWLEDRILNDLMKQVTWDFQWMDKEIPVTSDVIPPDSKKFLSTLCVDCYFVLHVWADGLPEITATNKSLILEKRDRVELYVVNPTSNRTSVFVSFSLLVVAELQPSIDAGVLRTLVQLLDTNITVGAGAFPPSWSFFMQDLMRGMILDMLWPEMKGAIEELTYGKGVKLSEHCGLDPEEVTLDIEEGLFAASARLAIPQLSIETCIEEIKGALPLPQKLFPV